MNFPKLYQDGRKKIRTLLTQKGVFSGWSAKWVKVHRTEIVCHNLSSLFLRALGTLRLFASVSRSFTAFKSDRSLTVGCEPHTE